MSKVREIYAKLWSVVTSDRDKAANKIAEIERDYNKEVLRRKNGANEASIIFEDGVWLRWVRPSDSDRGYRHGKMWCDKNIPRDIFRCVILPKYFGKYEDILWF